MESADLPIGAKPHDFEQPSIFKGLALLYVSPPIVFGLWETLRNEFK
ncbi:hypothetical protein VCR19J5_1220017 [Vibrio crassostreae]|uniref:Uncharacterized protein n=1 Tax=Vibrio crassostreae TaxID=246167 RepID=A0A822MWR3_9VIBR|nr:hypothetical protein VCR19J5_1220017 [Vibrio crassostreae]CDT16841.1 hypothetical protein VCR5J5_1560014 [Vibrio crassostreae]CDT49906.1 hypothetical protein VCR15J5_650014 [Vibrio crassostreae]